MLSPADTSSLPYEEYPKPKKPSKKLTKSNISSIAHIFPINSLLGFKYVNVVITMKNIMHLIAICTVSDIVSPPPLNASTNAEPQTRNITAEIYHDTTKGFYYQNGKAN